MEPQKKLKIINALTSGFTCIVVNKTRYFVKTPDSKITIRADQEFEKARYDNRFEYWLQDDVKELHLIKYGIWRFANAKTLKELNKNIENKKVELYMSSWNNPQYVESCKKHLIAMKKSRQDLLAKKHTFDHVTLTGYANKIRDRYIFTHTTYDENYNLLWADGKSNPVLLNRIMSKFFEELPSDADYRLIARSEPWRSYWQCGGINNFSIIGDQQRNLILYTQMYQNALENPECPEDEVFEDDDMFDGWMIYLNRKYKEEKDRAELNKKIEGKHQGAGEIFIPVQNNKDAEKINKMNDAFGRIVKAKREAKLQHQDKVSDLEIEELRLEQQQRK